MKIVQIAIGAVPPVLQYMMKKWEQYGYEYQIITELPEEYQQYGPRIGSDYLRMDILATEPDILYVDWDTEPKEEIDFSDIPMFFTQKQNPLWWYEGIDSCMYNGLDTALFAEARQYLRPVEGSIVYAIRRALKHRFYAHIVTLPQEENALITFEEWVKNGSGITIDNQSVNHIHYTGGNYE